MPQIHPLTGWALVLTLAFCFAPGGLIHRGQMQANPNAMPIFRR